MFELRRCVIKLSNWPITIIVGILAVFSVFLCDGLYWLCVCLKEGLRPSNPMYVLTFTYLNRFLFTLDKMIENIFTISWRGYKFWEPVWNEHSIRKLFSNYFHSFLMADSAFLRVLSPCKMWEPKILKSLIISVWSLFQGINEVEIFSL